MTPGETAILIIIGVAVLAYVMKLVAGDTKSEEETSGRLATDAAIDELLEEASTSAGGIEVDPNSNPNAIVPVTVDGAAFVHDFRGIRLLHLAGPEDEFPDWLQRAVDTSWVPYSVLNKIYFPGAGGGIQMTRPGTPFNVGDFTAARIERGVAGAYAWRLETLGRDGDFGFFPFATREAAESALELFQQHDIVQSRLDEDGDPVPVLPGDFEEARRIYEATEAGLAIDASDESPGEPFSDRR